MLLKKYYVIYLPVYYITVPNYKETSLCNIHDQNSSYKTEKKKSTQLSHFPSHSKREIFSSENSNKIFEENIISSNNNDNKETTETTNSNFLYSLNNSILKEDLSSVDLFNNFKEDFFSNITDFQSNNKIKNIKFNQLAKLLAKSGELFQNNSQAFFFLLLTMLLPSANAAPIGIIPEICSGFVIEYHITEVTFACDLIKSMVLAAFPSLVHFKNNSSPIPEDISKETAFSFLVLNHLSGLSHSFEYWGKQDVHEYIINTLKYNKITDLDIEFRNKILSYIIKKTLFYLREYEVISDKNIIFNVINKDNNYSIVNITKEATKEEENKRLLEIINIIGNLMILSKEKSNNIKKEKQRIIKRVEKNNKHNNKLWINLIKEYKRNIHNNSEEENKNDTDFEEEKAEDLEGSKIDIEKIKIKDKRKKKKTKSSKEKIPKRVNLDTKELKEIYAVEEKELRRIINKQILDSYEYNSEKTDDENDKQKNKNYSLAKKIIQDKIINLSDEIMNYYNYSDTGIQLKIIKAIQYFKIIPTTFLALCIFLSTIMIIYSIEDVPTQKPCYDNSDNQLVINNAFTSPMLGACVLVEHIFSLFISLSAIAPHMFFNKAMNNENKTKVRVANIIVFILGIVSLTFFLLQHDDNVRYIMR